MVKATTILRRTMLGGAVLLALGLGLQPGAPADAANAKRVCVSWRHFQEERWRIDEAGIKSVLGPAGYTYVSAEGRVWALARNAPLVELAGTHSVSSVAGANKGFGRYGCEAVARRGHSAR